MSDIVGVKSQPNDILPSLLRLIFRSPFARPIPIIAPTTACELDTGTKGSGGRFMEIRKFCRDTDANINSTNELDRTTISAVNGEIL